MWDSCGVVMELFSDYGELSGCFGVWGCLLMLWDYCGIICYLWNYVDVIMGVVVG